MSDNIDNMMLPEDALNRFQKPDTALLGLDISSNDYEQHRYGFKVGDIGFLISSETLCEVMKNFKVYPVPNTKKWMHGLVNLRGNLIPVYDMTMLLGLSDELINHDNLLVIDKGQESVGILIDGLPQPCNMNSWTELTQVPRLPADLSDYVTDAYTKDDIIWLGFNHKDFFMSVMDSVANW